MLYASSDQYSPLFKKNNNPFLILDASLTPFVKQYLNFRASEIN
jgi:hypothetical protein